MDKKKMLPLRRRQADTVVLGKVPQNAASKTF